MDKIIISEKNLTKIKDLINKADEKEIVLIAGDEKFNKKAVESLEFNFLVFSDYKEKNRLKQRSSHLDSVLCRQAAKKEIAFGFDISFLRNKDEKQKSDYLGRLIQDIKLCMKYKAKFVLVNANGDKHDIFAFLLTLGASTIIAKYAVENSFSI
ncbi:MAG: hypothetical protein WC533_03310 [Candidatus Pacearchaeota archaeon]